MRARSVPLVAALAGLVLPPVAAGGPAGDADPSARLEAWLDAFADARGLDGVVLVARGDRTLLHRAYGLANREWSVPNRPDTRFVVASVTKPITAVATLALVDSGDLHLDDTVSDHVPWYRADTGTRVTIHDLLAHTSGIPNFATREFWEGPPARLDWDRRAFLEEHGSGDLLFEPGSDAQYSDANYVLLATILERVTGETFGEVLERRVFRPAGMTDSETISRRAVHPGLASSYVLGPSGARRPQYINYADVQRGAGDVVSTAVDLSRFARALLRGDLLGPGTRELAFAHHTRSGFEGQMQGYGWNLGEIRTADGSVFEIAQAPGNNGGYNALLYLLPQSESVVAVLLNAGTPWLDRRLYEVAETLARIVLGDSPPTPRPSVVPVLRRAGEGAETVDRAAIYRALTSSGAFDPDERGVNRLGYELLRAGRVEQTVDLFTEMVTIFPESWNAHDSLGEAWWNARRYEQSLLSYRRSVELHPANDNGVRMIGILEERLAR